MNAPDNEFAFDFGVMKDAARRWKAEKRSRRKKVDARNEGEIEKADTTKRIGKRIQYLLDKVREAKPAGDPATHRLEIQLRKGEVAIEQGDSVTLERVLGQTRDFLSIEFLDGGILASRSVGRVVTRLPGGRKRFGTGFLVAPGLLMTNQHVLKTAEDAASSVVEFDYQRDRLGHALPIQTFNLRPDQFFLNDTDHDFALVAVEGDEALARFGYCPLIAREGKILIGDPINIIQHPNGEMKQIVVRENWLLDLPSKPALDKFAHYSADTEPGSSGSPVFNDQWDVIALHHSGVPATDAKGRYLDIDGNVWVEGVHDPARLAWIGNEGIRVSRLVAFISDAPLKSDQEKRLRDVFLEAGGKPRPMPTESLLGSALSLGPALPAASGQVGFVGIPPNSFISSAPIERGGRTAQFTIPISVTIDFGGAMAVAAPAPAAAMPAVPAPPPLPKGLVPAPSIGKNLGGQFAFPIAESAGGADALSSPEIAAPRINRHARTVDLLFATTRKPADSSQDAFSGERNDDVVTYGAASVRIPEKHRIGAVELPWKLKVFSFTLYEEERDETRHFVTRSLSVLTLDDWQSAIASFGETDALVFVHGFNTSFENGLYRFAQIIWDLKYAGLPVLFSWPSRGRIRDYGYDSVSALNASDSFADVLQRISEQRNIKRVHILAHSMGNLVVLEALAKHQNAGLFRIGELMMAAPDVDRDRYRKIAPKARRAASGMTLYASAADLALLASKILAGQVPRAGDVPPDGPIVVPGIDSIDVTALGAEMFDLGHSAYAETKSVLNDIVGVLAGTRPPHKRMVEINGIPDGIDPPTYWRYGG